MKTFLEWRFHPWLSLPVRLYIGGIFLMACWHKLLHPGAFGLDIAMFNNCNASFI